MKNNKINIMIICACTILIIGLIIFLKINHKDIPDSVRFKNEFEAYNNSKDEYENDCIKLNISEDNPLIVSNAKKIVNIMKNETAVVFFGYAFDNKTRSVINTLLDAAKEADLEKIYYVDIYNVRDLYVANNTLEPKLVRKGTDYYHEIVDMLSDHLNDYYVYSNNIGYKTDIKTIDTPTLVSIENGKVLEINVGLFGKDILNDDEMKILKNNYINIMKKVKKACTIEGNC